MKHWVIAPYHYDYPETWQRVWAFNQLHGFISLGWRGMRDCSALTKQQIKNRFKTKYPDSKQGQINSDSSMLFKFYNEIEPGHTIVARAGRKSIAAIGTVSRSAYYESSKASSAFPRNEAYPNHIDVDWHDEPRDLSFDRQVFGLMAIHSISSEKLDSLTNSPSVRSRGSNPDELHDHETYPEGAKRTTIVNAFERSSAARAACLKHHGYSCHVCEMSFAETYGEIGLNFIHVHHLNPVAARKRRYRINPIKHLVPVCPNCHAMMHTSDPPLTVKRLRKILAENES
jgi:predicted HNH restriction endonuclease